jgi:hypothetical protein
MNHMYIHVLKDRSKPSSSLALKSGRSAITLQLNIATASKHSTDVSLVNWISVSSAGAVYGGRFFLNTSSVRCLHSLIRTLVK